MEVRPAATGDYEQLCALFAQVDTMHREALPEVFQGIDGPARTREWVEQRIQGEEFALLVADRAGELLGLLEAVDSASPSTPLVKARRFVVVETLVVRPDRQRQGVGRQLMEALHAWAGERNVNQIQLHVWEFNESARAFYEALGYDTLSRKLGRTLD